MTTERSEYRTLPADAAWRHVEARDGFEVVFPIGGAGGCRLRGQTSAVEDGEPWSVRYDITVDERWCTRAARVDATSAAGERHLWLAADGAGHWLVNGSMAPHLDGCLDVDLESSACTNTLPVHREALRVGEAAAAPAAYVRAPGLSVERLEQRYRRIDDDGVHQRYDYQSPAFDTYCVLRFDDAGLVLDYPGLATRVA